VLSALLLGACGGPDGSPRVYPLDDQLRLGDLQVKGTHNSYHLVPDPLLTAEWGYSHAPLAEQAAFQGVRQFELDVHPDAETGELAVFHAPIVDAESTCAWLGACLFELRLWSDRNPWALPLVVLVEPKTEFAEEGALDLDLLEDSALSAWPRERILSPDDVQGGAESLGAAVADVGWPTLGEARQKLILVLLDRGALREEYSAGGTSLAGRLMFTDGAPGEALGAFALLDDPVGDAAAVAAAVDAGLLVRTRADAGGPPSAGEEGEAQAALDSGAHFLSTDYPAPVDGQDYWFAVEGGAPARCNPRTAPAACTAEDLEQPLWVR
jgi:hypothetical protein